MEYRLRRADGQYRYVLDTGEPYINKKGKFSGFIGSSTDITDRKNHENELRLSQLAPDKQPCVQFSTSC
jgi:PAS domain S-box-containing protein